MHIFLPRGGSLSFHPKIRWEAPVGLGRPIQKSRNVQWPG